jgi:transcriptional regulator with XRE-family HTH domain
VSEIGQLAARNVRRYRTERQFSIGELSRRSGLSKQTLSKLEQGEGNPTVETLDAVAAALNLSVRRLLTEWGSPVYVVPKDDGDWARGELRQSKLLDEIYGSGFVRTSLLRLERIGTSPAIDRSDGHARGSLHHCYVVAGQIRLGPDGDTVVAAQGDFVRFPADTPHTYEALSASALVHMVTTLPGVPQFGPTEQR